MSAGDFALFVMHLPCTPDSCVCMYVKLCTTISLCVLVSCSFFLYGGRNVVCMSCYFCNAFPVCVLYESACLVVAVVYVFVTDSEAQAPRLASRGYHL